MMYLAEILGLWVLAGVATVLALHALKTWVARR